MEALLFMFNSLAMIVLLYTGLRDERRGPGAPPRSPFRMIEPSEMALPKVVERGRDPWDEPSP